MPPILVAQMVSIVPIRPPVAVPNSPPKAYLQLQGVTETSNEFV